MLMPVAGDRAARMPSALDMSGSGRSRRGPSGVGRAARHIHPHRLITGEVEGTGIDCCESGVDPLPTFIPVPIRLEDRSPAHGGRRVGTAETAQRGGAAFPEGALDGSHCRLLDPTRSRRLAQLRGRRGTARPRRRDERQTRPRNYTKEAIEMPKVRKPGPNETVRWVPKQSARSSNSGDSGEAAKGVAAAQLHEQAVRISEGRGPAEPGEGFIRTGAPSAEDRAAMELNRREQAARFATSGSLEGRLRATAMPRFTSSGWGDEADNDQRMCATCGHPDRPSHRLPNLDGQRFCTDCDAFGLDPWHVFEARPAPEAHPVGDAGAFAPSPGEEPDVPVRQQWWGRYEEGPRPNGGG